ncbi:Uncharacterised protein [Enterococcus casseliflavus]|nr:Uncharacterised protein [Enterococcus casseliflavus]
MNVTESDCVTFARDEFINYLYMIIVYIKFRKDKIIK